MIDDDKIDKIGKSVDRLFKIGLWLIGLYTFCAFAACIACIYLVVHFAMKMW